MTAEVLGRPRAGRVPPTFAVPVVPITAALVVLARLPFLGRPATPDEAGFLMVASQWHVGGTSLYGDYWVDRPPLLIGIFRLADLTGGLVSLRLIGALAAAATVALLASTARRAFGPRAAAGAAIVAAALLVSPLVGAQMVDGELLAAPFVALGLRFAVECVVTDDPLAARGAALVAGLTTVLAALVKQNMVDVAVFAAVCWLVAWRTGRLSGRSLRDLVALAVAGAAVGYAVVMLWAMAHGTSPLAVYEATYPFRIKAGHVMAAIPGDTADLRLSRLVMSALLTGAPLVLLGFLVLLTRHRSDPVSWGLVGAGGYAVFSMLAGGSYWLHYLVQGVPVTAVAAGALAAAAPGLTARVLAPAVVGSAIVALVATGLHPSPAPGNAVGRALAPAVQPGDTMLSAFGDADILRSTGTRSPYPYLWSLPSRTLDPDMTLLRGILSGPDAPTWIVVRGPQTLGRLERHGVTALIRGRYREVGDLCGRTVYLLRGVTRSAPDNPGRCGGLVLP